MKRLEIREFQKIQNWKDLKFEKLNGIKIQKKIILYDRLFDIIWFNN